MLSAVQNLLRYNFVELFKGCFEEQVPRVHLQGLFDLEKQLEHLIDNLFVVFNACTLLVLHEHVEALQQEV